jgi:hypothetical protein
MPNLGPLVKCARRPGMGFATSTRAGRFLPATMATAETTTLAAQRRHAVVAWCRALPLGVRLAGVTALYVGAARLGLTMAFGAEQVTPVWPPTGIALAALLLLGRRAWPAIFLGAFISNASIGTPLAVAVAIATGVIPAKALRQPC